MFRNRKHTIEPVAALEAMERRSAMVAATARRDGYDARNVKGGIVRWTATSGAGRISR